MPTVNQTNRQISRRLGPLERSLKQKLNAFYNKRIRGSNAPIEIIRQKYGREIEELIRNNVQTSWIFAVDVTSERTGENIQLTQNDIAGIEKTTTKMINQFWTTSQKNLDREHQSVIENGKLVQMELFDTEAALLGVSSLILYLALNESFLSKSSELGLRVKYVVRDDCIDTKICLPFNGKIFEVGLAPELPQHRHCHCKLIPISSG